MEISLDTLISIATLFIGGGGGAFFTWRWQRAKAKAEAKEAEAQAESAEVSATKEMQDVYQQLITDIKTDRDEQKTYIKELKEDRRHLQEYNEEQKQYIKELKEDRRHLREERDDLRKRQDKTDEDVRDLKMKVARYGRILDCMRPFLCGREGCAIRVPVVISPEGEVESPLHPSQQNDIEPINNNEQ